MLGNRFCKRWDMELEFGYMDGKVSLRCTQTLRKKYIIMIAYFIDDKIKYLFDTEQLYTKKFIQSFKRVARQYNEKYLGY